MNDERSLIEQIKWMKQELNNLKIARPQGSSNISFFSQVVRYEDVPIGEEYSDYVVEARPVGDGGPNFFGTILGVSGSEGELVVGLFNYKDGVATWDVRLLAPEHVVDFVVCSTSPCIVSVRLKE